jgi:hypothetical protein
MKAIWTGRVLTGLAVLFLLFDSAYVAILIWGGLVLRDARLLAFAPWRRQA